MDRGKSWADRVSEIFPPGEKTAIACLFITGALLRLIWAFLKPPSARPGEAFNVAVSLASGSGFANALGPDAGPTAHLTPAMVLIAGAVYRVFGVHSPLSEAILALVAIGVSLAAFLLAYRLFGLFGMKRSWRLAGMGLLVLVPIFWTVEAVDFRYWEGGLATLLLLTLLTLLTKYHGRSVSIGEWLPVSFIAGILTVVSPTVGACAILSCAMFVISNETMRRWPLLGIVTVLVIVAAMVPWTIRNEIVMGRPIPLRDNVGLEMSVAYYPGAADGPMSNARYWNRVVQIQPYNSPAAYRKMQQVGGELPYYDQLKQGVMAWIAANPGQATKLTIRHIREFMFPPKWVFHMAAGRGMDTFRYFFFLMLCVLGYASAAYGFFSSPKSRYAAIATLGLPFAYMIVDPMPRYFWPNYPLLTFWSVALIWKIADAFMIRGHAARASLD